ncbi:MAG: polysaccharide biosynthesis tyrosine autokinase [Oxalobacteraceae bacterium]|nr:polysaccharide biosynthesis tyrosine autokinase [Oxalobacteraceae bacterium]
MNPLSPHLITSSEPPLILAEDKEADLMTYVQMIIDQRWLILFITMIISLAGALYAMLARPVYEASLMVHVEEKGQREPKNILGEAGSIIDYKTAAAAEVELLRSRRVIAHAIDNLRLYIDARPIRFPVIGGWLAQHDLPLQDWLPALQSSAGYAWGNERIKVGEFTVPVLLENRSFIVQAADGGRYHVTEKESGIAFSGKTNETARVNTRFGPIVLRIDALSGRPGVRFDLTRSSRIAAIESVQRALDVSEIGKQSGILQATLKGSSADSVYQLLNEIGREYMAQNSARRTEEADKSLAYLNQRLPELKQQLEQAEARYNQFRNTHGTVDLGEEGRITLQRSAAARTRRIELEQKRTELLSRYTANHPAVMSIDEQLDNINAELRQTAIQLKNLPVLEQEMVRLSRDVKVNSELYAALVSSAQQLQLTTVGRTSNVRLVDAPEKPEQPVTPNRPRIIAIAIFAGLFLGVVVAFLRRSLQTAFEDPVQLERASGVPVYASIPHSRAQESLAERTDESANLPLLSRISSMDIAVESLRNFRTALQFCLNHAPNRIVLITGPTEGMGKSFVSVNLAAIMAASGRRVLLIDGDLRDGHLHRYFHGGRQGGLSDLLSGTPSDVVLRRDVLEHLDFIATGNLPPNPSEMLLRPTMASLLSQMAPHYDLILIDAAPLLAVADSLILGAHAGAIFLATRAGVTTPAEVSESLKRLARAGLSAKGLLFNDMPVPSGRYGYGSGYSYGKYRQLGYSGAVSRHPKTDVSASQ